MIAAFTGTSKAVPTPAQLEKLELTWNRLHVKVLHHGGAPHADQAAHQLAIRHGIARHVHPSTLWADPTMAYWYRTSHVIYPAKHPLARNPDIVRPAEILIVVPRLLVEEQRSGTWATARWCARHTQTPVFIIWPSGEHETWHGIPKGRMLRREDDPRR